MRVKIDITFSGADLASAGPLLTQEDLRAVGAEVAQGQVARVDRGLGAEGVALKRNDRGLFLRRTGRMLRTLGPREASAKGVVVRSSARYAEHVQRATPFLSLDEPDEAAAALLKRIEDRLGSSKSKALI